MVYRASKTSNRKIHAGLLRDRIGIFEVTKKPGEDVKSQYDIKEKFECWAKVDFEQRDVIAGLDGSIDQNFDNDEYKFIVRLMGKSVTSRDFVKWRDQWFKVSSVSRLNPFEDFLVIKGRPANPDYHWDYNELNQEGVQEGINTKEKGSYLW